MNGVRRSSRADWECTVLRGTAAVEDDDDLYWLRIPMGERARTTWELSRELYAIAARNQGVFDEETGLFVKVGDENLERRLPRSAFGITRR